MPTAQLVEVFERYKPRGMDMAKFAVRCGLEERNLKKILVTQDYATVGIDKADKIILGLGFTIGALERTGEITVIPGDDKWHCAEKMAEIAQRTALEGTGIDPKTLDAAPLDKVIGLARKSEDVELVYAIARTDAAGVPLHMEDWPHAEVFTAEEFQSRIDSLKQKRAAKGVPNEKQRELLTRDKARIKARNAAG